MPNYNYKCKDCSKEVCTSKRISEISNHKEICLDCGSTMTRVVSSFSSKVKMDAEQRSEKDAAEVRKIVAKVKGGDLNLISEIYGEK